MTCKISICTGERGAGVGRLIRLSESFVNYEKDETESFAPWAASMVNA